MIFFFILIYSHFVSNEYSCVTISAANVFPLLLTSMFSRGTFLHNHIVQKIKQRQIDASGEKKNDCVPVFCDQKYVSLSCLKKSVFTPKWERLTNEGINV